MLDEGSLRRNQVEPFVRPDQAESLALAEALEVDRAARLDLEILADQRAEIVVEQDLHRLGDRLHARGEVHARAEDVVDVLLHADDRADDRPAGDADPALPFLVSRPAPLANVPAAQERHLGDVLGVVGGLLRNAVKMSLSSETKVIGSYETDMPVKPTKSSIRTDAWS